MPLDDERCARFFNEDESTSSHDGKIMAALNLCSLFRASTVIAQNSHTKFAFVP